MDTTPILSQGLRFIPVARGEFLCIGERVEILGRSSDSASSGEEIGDYRGKEIRSEMQTMMILKEVSCWSTSNNFNCRLWRGLRIRVDQAIVLVGKEIKSDISSDT